MQTSQVIAAVIGIQVTHSDELRPYPGIRGTRCAGVSAFGMKQSGQCQLAVALVQQVRAGGLAGRHGALGVAAKHASGGQPRAVNAVQLDLPVSAT
jgi:hypothetical protein